MTGGTGQIWCDSGQWMDLITCIPTGLLCLTLYAAETKLAEFANGVDFDGVADHEPSLLDPAVCPLVLNCRYAVAWMTHFELQT